ncbi:MAG: two-component system, chemotaxis family, protein-glutamate methylesterase/glutaminase [Actinomycetota bacterium]|nr:two-component system, chemotaxis family, protein-glutamate methylesterase/glutaminase [Actinomycetota bacterium]
MTCRIVVVGSSWGGVTALGRLLAGLPADLAAPVVVAQHRRDAPSMLARLLERQTDRTVCEAADKDTLTPGIVYLAPAGYHLLVERPGHLALSTEGPVRFARPSIDVLFESAATAYRSGVVGVVLTGTNDDGAAGLAAIVARGGHAVVQDPASAERPAMPLAALATGIEAVVLPLDEIGPYVGSRCGAEAIPA